MLFVLSFLLSCCFRFDFLKTSTIHLGENNSVQDQDMFSEDNILALEHEILKENHETLKTDHGILQERIRHAEEAYEMIKFHHQNKAKELESANARLLKECERERSEKETYKKMLEMKTKDSDTIEELLLEKQKTEELAEILKNRYLELVNKLGVLAAESAYVRSLYDAGVVATGTPSAVMSGIGETDHVIGQGEKEVNHNGNNNNDTAARMEISDERDGEHDKPLRTSNITPHPSGDRNQEKQCKNGANSSSANQASGETITPMAVYHPPLFSAATTSSSSESYDYVAELPPNWPEWAIPKDRRNNTKKS